MQRGSIWRNSTPSCLNVGCFVWRGHSWMIPEWEAAWGFGDGFHAPAHLALNGAAERGLEPLKGMGMLRRATWSKEERGGGCGGGRVSFGNVPSEFDQIPWILGLGEEFGLGAAVTGCHELALVPPFFSPLFRVSGSLHASVSLSSQHGGCVWARLGSPPWWHKGTRSGATTSDRDSLVPTWLGQQPRGML